MSMDEKNEMMQRTQSIVNKNRERLTKAEEMILNTEKIAAKN